MPLVLQPHMSLVLLMRFKLLLHLAPGFQGIRIADLPCGKRAIHPVSRYYGAPLAAWLGHDDSSWDRDLGHCVRSLALKMHLVMHLKELVVTLGMCLSPQAKNNSVEGVRDSFPADMTCPPKYQVWQEKMGICSARCLFRSATPLLVLQF